MGFLLTGYVLEPPRVGQANSPFTFTTNIKVPDQAAFNVHYPTNESAPRTDYLVFVRVDGDLPDAVFCWTKNEVIARFDYEGRNQRYKPLPGSAPKIVGSLAADANTNRLKVQPPLTTDFVNYPVRLTVGVLPGTVFTVATVPDEASFTTPPAGTVQVSLDKGTLNWRASDITTFLGQDVRFQQQGYFAYTDSKGDIGVIDDLLLLNPIPGAGQFPLIRIGFRAYLTPIEKANEGAFSVNPAAGTVEWARTSGRLKFNSGDVATYTGLTIYYDGTVFSFSSQLTPTSHGTVASPGFFSPVPDAFADTFFRVPGVVQFAGTEIVDVLDPFGVLGTVQILSSTGQIQFSIADRAAYGPFSVQAYVPDLPIERGMALRFRRTPVDPEALDPTLKDVSALYTTTGAILADPIIGSPKVLLPATPLEDQPIVVNVDVGTGSFVGELPRLDVPSPPEGLGYVIDYPNQELHFARRKNNIVFPQSAHNPYGTVQLSDAAIVDAELILELETSPGSNVFAPLTLNEDVTFDFNAGLAKLVTTVGEVLVSSSSGAFSGTTFTDTAENFTAAGVATNDLLTVLSGASKGVYTINSVGTTTLTTDLPGTTETKLLYEIRRGREVLADRFFKTIPPLDPNTKVERLNIIGTATNSPRLSIPVDRISVSRFRLGKTTFLTTVTVANDGAFSSPPQGTVEVSLTTGNLNFSTADLGPTNVYQSVTLEIGTDFSIQPQLGFISFTDRLLQSEEVFLTYAVLDANNNKVVVQERGTFSVRKELTVHPNATSTIPFNPLGRELASNPPARAFRGGRPQVTGTNVTFDYTNSTVTFLPDKLRTDVLPHGATVSPSERIYVDYFIYEAIGGERNVTVLQPPMLGVTILIDDGSSSFQIPGDRTAEFPKEHLLLVAREHVYLLDTPTYDSVADMTTVNLQAPQVFLDDSQKPSLEVTSGRTRVNAVFPLPSYFVTETAQYETVARGSDTMKFVGDQSSIYVSGVIVFWSNGTDIFDFNKVEGSKFDDTTNRTTVNFSSKGAKQYKSSEVTLKRSTNPILASATAAVSTNRSPDLTLPYLVFRRIEGQVGVVLAQPDDYKIDPGGRITFTQPLQDNEALVICYTGATIISDGRDFRASYTHLAIPDDTNGLAGQVLTMDYSTYSPDTFYWRVETITTFRGELATKYGEDAQSSIPSGGPRLQNSSGPKLWEQGRESIFFNEEDLANEDLVARNTLKFYNDGVNFLEDALQSMDGRIVGDHNGRFHFDGNLDNPPRDDVTEVTNDIDDQIKVGDGPVTITFPPFAVTFGATYQAMWQPSRFSRFYPTFRRLYGVAADGTNLENEDTILVLGFGSIAFYHFVFRRLPWAVTTVKAKAGATVLHVDNADGATELLRPAFDPSTYYHRVAVITQDGIEIVPALFPTTLVSKTTTTMHLADPLPADVPVGSTVYQVLFDLIPPPAPPPPPYIHFYRMGYDVGGDPDQGTLTHIVPFAPFDGSDSDIPAGLLIQNPAGGEVLDVHVSLFNKLTEPYRVPALDGSTHDDDNNRQIPILSPTANSEGGLNLGGLYLEKAVVKTSTGTLRTATTSPFVGTGSLDATKTIITNNGGPWPSPVPKVFDLVEIRSGLNANTGFHRISAVGASTITVSTAFGSVDTNFTFTVTVSNSLATGATGTFTTTTLTDAGATFDTDNVQPGDTVVVTSGANAGLRRQVIQVTSPTQLLITTLPSGGVASYRVDNALGTFGGANSILDDDLVPALQTELLNLDTSSVPLSERQGIEAFFNQFFTTIASGTTGQTFGSMQFHDANAHFISAGVVSGMFVYIRAGVDAGIYKVDTVSSGTDLTVTATFPGSTTGITYLVVTAEGLPLKALQDAFSVLQKVDTAIANTNSFYSLVTTPVTVAGDASAFARRTLTSDLDTRATQVNSRINDITDPATGSAVTLSSVLASSGKLYDKRYTWIDARTNLEKGILPKQQRAVADRLKAEEDIQKQLIKLLTTGAT